MSSNRSPDWKTVHMVLVRPRPITLSEAELGETAPTEATDEILVNAWVRFPETPIRVHARVVAWTDHAVHVEWTMHDGATHRAWVWKGAISPRGAGA
jgi:hypothetical protein